MSKLAEKSVKAQENIEIVETALGRTQSALRAAERADELATETVVKSRRFLKLILLLTVLGIVALVIQKVMSRDSTPPGNPNPYGSSSTEV